MISKHDIKKLSELARIEVTDAETEKLQHDLERILAYVEQLSRAETGAVDELTNVVGLSNIFADDAARVAVQADTTELVHAAPSHGGSFVKVPPIWKKK